MILLAALNTLMYKYSGQEDIIIGTPIAARTHFDTERILGMFINTLALRNSQREIRPLLSSWKK